MNCRWSPATLVIEGNFLAASTGVGGGTSRVNSIFNQTVPHDWHDPDPLAYINGIACKERIQGPFFCLLTAVPMDSLAICRSGLLDVFITAGTSASTINIISVSREGLTGNALLESIATMSSAKTAALLRMGLDIIATPTDAVITACEGDLVHQYAGIATPLGRSLVKCVMAGVPRALSMYESGGGGPTVIMVK